MALEIERRFIVSEGHSIWTSDGVAIVQGYIPVRSGGNIRIRVTDGEAVMTRKRWIAPGVRSEVNTPIPFGRALALLQTQCSGGIVEKVRHRIPLSGHLWEVDVFTGENEGLVIAEVELDHVGQDVQLPSWIVSEVTGDSRYGNSSLAKRPFQQWGVMPILGSNSRMTPTLRVA